MFVLMTLLLGVRFDEKFAKIEHRRQQDRPCDVMESEMWYYC
jgi:hypothetical protein